MKPPSSSASVLAALSSLILLQSFSVHAKPYPKGVTPLHAEKESNSTLELRQSCDGTLCGWYQTLCCSTSQYCYTDENNEAQCGEGAAPPGSGGSGRQGDPGSGGGGGGWQMFTTTYVETDLLTVTTTYSAFVSAVASAPICNVNLGQTACGSVCCPQGQFCSNGVCVSSGATTPGMASNSAFIRPTSATVATFTSTGTATTTLAFQTPIGTNGSSLAGVTAAPANNGLSGGAIAGIVIGVLAALFLLFIICAFLCCRAIFDAIFGRRRRKETTTYIQSHHSRHSGGSPPPRRWFGVLPARPSRPQKQSSGLGPLLGVGAFLGTLAVILGLKRRKDRIDEKSSYTATEYDYSEYTTSESSASSDRRTRNTRGSRR